MTAEAPAGRTGDSGSEMEPCTYCDVTGGHYSDCLIAPTAEERLAAVLAWIDEAPEQTPGLDLLRQIAGAS